MADSNRSDPKRGAELAAVLAQYCATIGASPGPHHIAAAVMALQKAARSAKRQAEHACNYGYRDGAHEARATKRQDRAQDRLSLVLLGLIGGGLPAERAPTVELGGDPRGPCARLHIPGQRGDGWGDGFAIY